MMRVHTDWLLTPQKVAIHLPTATAVVADVHLGYAECRRRAGDAVPHFDLEAHLEPLGKAMRQEGVHRVVLAGDLFEGGFESELAKRFDRWLGATGLELEAVVPGNHDRHMGDDWPVHPQGFMLDGWRVVHGNADIPAGLVVHGHFHPSVRWQGQKLSCYLTGSQRLVLPAYSPDAAGTNLARDRTWRHYRCLAVLGSHVIDLGQLATGEPWLPV